LNFLLFWEATASITNLFFTGGRLFQVFFLFLFFLLGAALSLYFVCDVLPVLLQIETGICILWI
jgi:hypothetical protein